MIFFNPIHSTETLLTRRITHVSRSITSLTLNSPPMVVHLSSISSKESERSAWTIRACWSSLTVVKEVVDVPIWSPATTRFLAIMLPFYLLNLTLEEGLKENSYAFINSSTCSLLCLLLLYNSSFTLHYFIHCKLKEHTN